MDSKSKVILFECREYNLQKIKEYIYRGFFSLGGVEKYIKHGYKVFLKPNMLGAKPPERGITTHPVILEAVINIVREAGGTPVIGDSPAGSIKGGMKRFWEETGFRELSERTGVELVNIEKEPIKKKEVKGHKYFISKPVLDADIVINLPKLKTHFFTLYTGGVKNLYGTVPGLRKSDYHKIAPNPDKFSKIIAEIFSIVKPEITIMDGILAMDGNGPSSGKLNWMHLLAVSNDAVAMDRICEEVVGLKVGEVKTALYAEKLGAGNYNSEKIELVGERLAKFKEKGFTLPSNRALKMIPGFLGPLISPFVWARPVADKEKCTFCKICIASCPVKCMREDEKQKIPVIDYKECINCNCCNEVCPEGAIYHKFSRLAKVIL
ncbi:DUF362 domain-containing protein [candidate division KSB1 bacterium]